MMRHAFAATFAAACIATTVQARAQDDHVPVHVAPVTLQQWGQRVGQELDRRMSYPVLAGGQPFASGVVKVKFNCSDSGQPDKVTLLKTSGSSALDRAALAAVRKVATLHPLPDGMKHDQQYQAVLLFATDQDSHDVMMRRIRSEATKTNGWFKGQDIETTLVGPIQVAAR